MLLIALACAPVTLDIPVETDSDADVDVPAVDLGLATATLDCAERPPADGKTLCNLKIVGHDGTVWTDGTAGVGLRGRSSSAFPKPQFSVELREDDGVTDRDEDLFGFGASADWVLNGMYIDRALLRNKFAFDTLRDATGGASWAPESVYAELIWNGEDYGVYALSERVGRGEGRLDFPKADDGSRFIVKADEAGFTSSVQYGHWAIVYPNAPTPDASDAIEQRLKRVEALIAAKDPAVRDELDLSSAVAFVLIEEFTKNNDGFFLSHHLSTGPDGRLVITPWDLDLTLGQPTYNDNANPETWLLFRTDLITDLLQIPGFRDELESTWAAWRTDVLTDEHLDARISALQAQVGSEAIERNFERWPIGSIDFYGSLPRRTSYDDEMASVRAWLPARVAWMDANIQAY